MYTNPEDYYKFEQGLSNGRILNKSDYNYLTHLKMISYNGYSGGMYVSNYFKTKNVYGSLAYNHVNNWVNFSLDNRNGVILFFNQTSKSAGGNKNHAVNLASSIQNLV